MSKKLKVLYIALVLLLIVSLSFLGYRIYIKPKAQQNERQAIFLTNGQVYFGNIAKIDKNYLILKNIYYLKEQSSLTPNDQDPNKKISIIKLGNELHGPEDQMYITKDQVLFYEDMKNSSRVNEAIKKYLEQK